MPYFAIKEKGSVEDACVCHEDSLETVKAEMMLGPGDWLIREIDENEANLFAQKWMDEGCYEEDICPICGDPRSRVLRGEIILKSCKTCESIF